MDLTGCAALLVKQGKRGQGGGEGTGWRGGGWVEGRALAVLEQRLLGTVQGKPMLYFDSSEASMLR